MGFTGSAACFAGWRVNESGLEAIGVEGGGAGAELR
jgi:uncharacterized membrane protein YsdA (DUF1294 family)